MTTQVRDKADHPAVIHEINRLKDVCRLGVKIHKEFMELNNISITRNGNLFYTNANNKSKSVSSFIKEMTGVGARWINHIYFKDAFGRERKFKTFVSQMHNLNLS